MRSESLVRALIRNKEQILDVLSLREEDQADGLGKLLATVFDAGFDDGYDQGWSEGYSQRENDYVEYGYDDSYD